MNSRAGLRKVVKTVKGKKGIVRRSYWVKSGQQPKPGRRALNQNAQPQKEGFLRRHAGKLAVGAALLGAAALNRHKLAGAARGAGLALNAHKHHELAGGAKHSLREKARDAFGMAKMGYSANRGMDRIDKHTQALAERTAGARGKMRDWRRSHGSALAEHLTNAGGHAAVEHLGGRAGGMAGSAIGGLMAGPLGAQLGGFIGGHAGSFLANRHTSHHIIRSGERLASWMKR